MEAIEFQAVLHDGTVTVPSEYAAKWEGKTIRAILLDDANDLTTADSSPEIGKTPSLLSRLKAMRISAPADFSENLDAYLRQGLF